MDPGSAPCCEIYSRSWALDPWKLPGMFLLLLDGHVKDGTGFVPQVCSHAWSHWHVAKSSGGCWGAPSVEIWCSRRGGVTWTVLGFRGYCSSLSLGLMAPSPQRGAVTLAWLHFAQRWYTGSPRVVKGGGWARRALRNRKGSSSKESGARVRSPQPPHARGASFISAKWDSHGYSRRKFLRFSEPSILT